MYNKHMKTVAAAALTDIRSTRETLTRMIDVGETSRAPRTLAPGSRQQASINGLLPEGRAEEHGEAQLQSLFYRHTLHWVERPALEPPHVRLHLAQVPADLLLDGGWQLVRATHLQ